MPDTGNMVETMAVEMLAPRQEPVDGVFLNVVNCLLSICVYIYVFMLLPTFVREVPFCSG